MSLNHSRAAFRSAFRSPAVALAAGRARLRRHRLGRLAGLAFAALLVVVAIQDRLDAAADAQARWGLGATVWVTGETIPAGSVVEPGAVRPADAPAGLVPAGAATVDPTGKRVRVDLVPGEIILADRLVAGGSANAARTPDGQVTVALDRTSDLFAPGDRVDLHDQVDGHRLVEDGVVVAVTDGDVAVAVDPAMVDAVIAALGRGGVVPVLRAG